MNIILLGPQGSGKGTQARLLVQKYGLFYVSSGDLVRKAAQTDAEVAAIMKQGKLIPDEQTFKYIKDYLIENKVDNNILFDGYPRSAEQFALFKKDNIVIDLAFILTISDEESVRRLSARRMNPTTGEIYNLITNPPGADVDQSNLVQREDDKPEVIRQRLQTYHTVTEKLLTDLEQSGVFYKKIDGERPIEVIFEELVKILLERGLNAKN